ncbi:hypothetical protein XENTR_v10023738 [Xenopus tropicalis]|nr:hypothetical protein XENTR_v10023738 [Xenopus tropicalis]
MAGFNSLIETSAQNQTPIREVFILGFQTPRSYRVGLFISFFAIYTLILSGNLLVISPMLSSRLLYSPMYFFLSHLSLSEVLLSTNITPLMLDALLSNGVTMSISGCLVQLQLFGTFVATESLLLTVMSYDRYLAICRPLHYASIMDYWSCIYLSITCWALATLISSISVGFISTLYFCGSNIIDHFFCDFAPLLRLSCSDTSMVELEVSLLSTTPTIFPFLFIIVTYCCIIRSILRMPSLKGKEKAFSTCSSHLGVVSMYYMTIIMVYVMPNKGHSKTRNKVVSLLYTMLTPFLNPIIYSLRNQEIKSALGGLLKRKHAIKMLL